MKKKFLALLLSLVLVLGSIPAAFAADPALSLTVETETELAIPGETINFTLYLNGADTIENGVWGVDFWLSIPKGLSVVEKSFKKSADISLDGTPSEKTMGASLTTGDSECVITDAKVALVTFSCTVDEDATGTLTIGVTSEAAVYGEVVDYTAAKGDVALPTLEIPVHEHNFEWYECDEENHWHECDVCGIVDLGAHEFEFQFETPATCYEKGNKFYMCSVCGYQHIEYIDMIDHVDEDENGYCDVCETPLCHQWEDATCTEPKTCKICGLTEGKPLGHDWEIVGETDDEITFKCKACGVEMTEAKDNNTVVDVRPDGTVVITTTNEDGTVTVETRKDGITTIVTYDANGNIISVVVNISKRVAIDASKSGEAVDLSLLAALVAGEGLNVTINTNYDEPIAVEVPVADVTPGCVIVIVDAEGNETVVADTKMTENGLVFACPDGATIKVEDKSISFADIKGENWYNDAIDFVSARGIMTGMTANTFAQSGVTTRAQLWTMLARLSGVDTTCTEGNWYDVARAWAMENGISDGTNANGELTREMLVTMLFRFVGETGESKSIADFSDAANASDWAKAALEWAYGEGVMNGNADGTMDPAGNTTRAQMAQFFMNFIQNI